MFYHNNDILQKSIIFIATMTAYRKPSMKPGVQRRRIFFLIFPFVCHQNNITKNAYSTILKISSPKNWKFSDKNSDIFHISAKNTDCGYSLELPHQGRNNKYTQSMFLSRNKKNNVYPCKPQFYYIKVGFKGGSKLYYVLEMIYEELIHLNILLPISKTANFCGQDFGSQIFNIFKTEEAFHL